MATYEEPRRALFLEVPVAPAREYSEATAAVIDVEVRKLLAEARQRVLETLAHQRGTLESLAGLLKTKEVVDRSALLEILGAPAAQPATRVEG